MDNWFPQLREGAARNRTQRASTATADSPSESGW